MWINELEFLYKVLNNQPITPFDIALNTCCDRSISDKKHYVGHVLELGDSKFMPTLWIYTTRPVQIQREHTEWNHIPFKVIRYAFIDGHKVHLKAPSIIEYNPNGDNAYLKLKINYSKYYNTGIDIEAKIYAERDRHGDYRIHSDEYCERLKNEVIE